MSDAVDPKRIILVNGDKAQFANDFTPTADVKVQDGTLTGQGHAQLGSKTWCVEGDESTVQVPMISYSTPEYTIMGFGTLTIKELASDQVASYTCTDSKKVLLVGGSFTSKFTPTIPALKPPPGAGPPIPDSTSSYEGSGTFKSTTNSKLTGT